MGDFRNRDRAPGTPAADRPRRLTRREVLAAGGAGLAGAALGAAGLDRSAGPAEGAAYGVPGMSLDLPIERGASLRVLRWGQFVPVDQPFWDKMTQAWSQKTGVKVTIEYVNWPDIPSKTAVAANVGAGPDIVTSFFDDPHLYPDKLVPLDDVADYLGKKYGGWYDLCRAYGFNTPVGHWIALPMGTPGATVNYRVSWVREAGFDAFPKDIPNFLRLAKALRANGHPTGFSLGHAVGDANAWTHWWLWAHGGKVWNADGSAGLHSDGTIHAIENCKELYSTMTQGVGSWLDPDNNKAFLSGNISMTNNGISIYFIARAQFPTVALDMDHAIFPVGPAGRPAELQLMPMAMVFKYSKYPNAAKDYLRFCMEEGNYDQWINTTLGYYDATLRAYENVPVWNGDPKVKPFQYCLRRGQVHSYATVPGPRPAAAHAEYVVVDMFANATVGGKSARDALANAEQRLARIARG
ncbi:MAG: extracellular solute-binding protein [Bacillati bacterium ANGP1]|uniref:Extracellular solute-binding protein n=1 Tax=Candidatus Segetimicrobium genomatis TaxID=2569760 RepID=A0A537JXF8_9BACT|nr:MAG: extracellular solute-binding protein [Terrabacteria group bacterium ANGP1]HTD48293.1 extracellular solute-binding protein [bacterium]